MEEARARVAVIDDHVLFAEALQMALDLTGHDVVRLATEAGRSGMAALATAASSARLDVAILDLDLGRAGDGVGLVAPLTRAGVAVVVVTATEDRARWGHCLRLGAVGVLVKTAPLREIVAAVAAARAGRAVMPAGERDQLVRLWHTERARHQEETQRFARLTRREREVLAELARGRRIAEIASAAFVAESTVRCQVKSILGKLGVGSQLAAVSLVHRSGWTGAATAPGSPGDVPQMGEVARSSATADVSRSTMQTCTS